MKKVLFWVLRLDVGVIRLDVRVSTLDIGAVRWDNFLLLWL
jgi:hypothetical protein